MSSRFFERLGEYLGENAADLERQYNLEGGAAILEPTEPTPLPPAPANRLVKIALGRQWIIHFFGGDVRLDMSKLPPDAKVIEAFYEPCRSALMVIVESESFDAVDEGCTIPDLEPDWVVGGNSST
jgi:hypothetical protein